MLAQQCAEALLSLSRVAQHGDEWMCGGSHAIKKVLAFTGKTQKMAKG